MDELTNEDLDHYIDISNRADGKSFNYIAYAMYLSINHKVGFCLLSRNWSVRSEYESLIFKICDVIPEFNIDQVSCFRQQHYINIFYDGELIGIITDLNSATNLKYSSNFLSSFPLIIYDEFLSIDSDYLDDEVIRLKTIYGSINRQWNIPIIKYPKIIYLGNAVNFTSPILEFLDLYKPLEDQELNTIKIYDNKILSIGYNEATNEKRNLRAFDEGDDPFTLGAFSVNDYQLTGDKEEAILRRSKDKIIVKLSSNYLIIEYNLDYKLISLSIVGYTPEPYIFNTMLKDNTELSTFLDQSFYSNREIKKHNRGVYKYKNSYSKDFITSHLNNIKIHKLVKIDRFSKREKVNDLNEKDLERQAIEETKRKILERFIHGY